MECSKTTYANIEPGDTITTPSGNVTITHTEDNGSSVTLYTGGGGVLIGHPSEGTWIVEDNSLGGSNIIGLLMGFESDSKKGRDKSKKSKETKELEENKDPPGWHQDGSYTTLSGVTYTSDEMHNAAYSGCEGGL